MNLLNRLLYTGTLSLNGVINYCVLTVTVSLTLDISPYLIMTVSIVIIQQDFREG
jgi:hypothetical protein